jgi:hypothetical protein
MQNGPKPNMSAQQPRPAASFAGRSRRWTSSATRAEPIGPQNARRNYERYLALARTEAQIGNTVERTIISTPNIISDRCPRIQKERNNLCCDATCGQGEPSMIRVSMWPPAMFGLGRGLTFTTNHPARA